MESNNIKASKRKPAKKRACLHSNRYVIHVTQAGKQPHQHTHTHIHTHREKEKERE